MDRFAHARMRLFAALVDLPEELLEDLLLQTLTLINLRDHLLDLTDALLLVVLVDLLELQLIVELLDLGLASAILAAIVLLEHSALLRRGNLERLVDQPRALVVLNVRANLAQHRGVGEVVKVVVLDLEVLAHGDEDVLRDLQVLGRSLVAEVQGKGNGEVEAVVGGLVDDDEGVLLEREVVEVDFVLGGREQVASLAQLGLEGDLVEELNKINVLFLVLAEVLLQQDVDGRLEHEGVVDGDHANIRHEVPARAAAAGLGAVHDIIRNEEESLEELNHPAESGRVKELVLGQVATEQKGRGIDDRHAAVAFAADSVVVQALEPGVSVVKLMGACSNIRS